MKKVTKDGRTILTGKHYTQFRLSIWERCEGFCEKCGSYMTFDWDNFTGMHVHRKRGRGGGKRNDSTDAVMAMCNYCHRKEHGQ